MAVLLLLRRWGTGLATTTTGWIWQGSKDDHPLRRKKEGVGTGCLPAGHLLVGEDVGTQEQPPGPSLARRQHWRRNNSLSCLECRIRGSGTLHMIALGGRSLGLSTPIWLPFPKQACVASPTSKETSYPGRFQQEKAALGCLSRARRGRGGGLDPGSLSAVGSQIRDHTWHVGK